MPKALSKTQKKLDNALRGALQSVCESTLKDLEGFSWLTHQADYANFPASLLIICIFEYDEQLDAFTNSGSASNIRSKIQQSALRVGVRLKNPPSQIRFDSEQACKKNHGGNWRIRLAMLEGRAVPRNRP